MLPLMSAFSASFDPTWQRARDTGAHLCRPEPIYDVTKQLSINNIQGGLVAPKGDVVGD